MIEDLQDELPSTIKKAYKQNSKNHTFLSIFIVWFIFVAIFFLFCLADLKATFRNKTKDQIVQEAKEYAARVETKTMQLFYVSQDNSTIVPFNVKVEVTGAGSYNDAIEGLLKDTPKEVLEKLCINAIPKGSVLKSLKINKNKVTVELSINKENSNYSLIKQQINNTLLSVNPDLSEINIYINDNQI